MNTIAAQEIKRRGITAADEKLKEGPVYVIKNNKPQYVILSEDRYNQLVAAQSDVYMTRVRMSLEDVRAGRVKKFKNAAELLKAIGEPRFAQNPNEGFSTSSYVKGSGFFATISGETKPRLIAA